MKIVVLEPEHMAVDVRSRLQAIGQVEYGPFDNVDLERHLAGCRALMVRLGRYVGSEVMAAAPELRFIVSATTGLDHIDLEEARRRSVRVISLRDCPELIQDVSSTAELTWGLILSLTRHIPAAVAHVRGGGWNRTLFWGTQLRGKRLGIIGYGRIGTMVAGYGVAFGMDVVAHDRRPESVAPPVRSVAIDELLSTSDIVSVHVTADSANRHLIDEVAISKMKRGSHLVNTARGFVVDSSAAARALAEGLLAGVAIDVVEGEERQLVDGDALVRLAREAGMVQATPHIGGATIDAIAKAEGAVVSVLRECAEETQFSTERIDIQFN